MSNPEYTGYIGEEWMKCSIWKLMKEKKIIKKWKFLKGVKKYISDNSGQFGILEE